MDEEKKSEASGEESERLGQYLIEEQVQQAADSQKELYLVRNETSGTTGLLRKFPAEEGAVRRKNWRMSIACWASRGYSVADVEFTDLARAQDMQSAESLLLTLEEVLEEVRRMLQAASALPEPRFRWPLGWGVASAVTVGALLLALVRLAPVSQPPGVSPAPRGHEEPAPSSAWLVNTMPPEQPMLARPLPKEPFKGQKRPPCTRYVEVELIGACWGPHELKAPCPDVLYEHQGKCYVPLFSAKPPPSSLEP